MSFWWLMVHSIASIIVWEICNWIVRLIDDQVKKTETTSMIRYGEPGRASLDVSYWQRMS